MGPQGFGVHIPFVAHLGLAFVHMDGDASELRLQPQPEHHNSFAVVHGGVLMTLLDVAMALAARSQQPDLGAVTVDMTSQFLRPASGPLVARGRVLHRSATLVFTEATVWDAQDRACTHATGTFKLIRRLPTGGTRTTGLQTLPTD